jgi:hypothetical protein
MIIFRSTFTEDSTAVNMARLTGLEPSPDEEGTPIVQADISEIKYWAYTNDEIVEGHDGIELEVDEVIFDDLQGWNVDEVGFNFKHVVDHSAFPIGGTIGTIEYKFTHNDGLVKRFKFKGRVEETLNS